jgi:signal peptidase complex subunit 3
MIVLLLDFSEDYATASDMNSLRGRPNYYSKTQEEYANIRFSLDADLSSLFTWNTKQVFVYVTAVWPSKTASHGSGDLEKGSGLNEMNEAVIWDRIITSPSSDHLSNIEVAAKKKLIKSAEGKKIDPSRFVSPSRVLPYHSWKIACRDVLIL